MQWLKTLFTDSLPQALGGILATLVLTLFGLLWRRDRAARDKLRNRARDLVFDCLGPEMVARFSLEDLVARTSDDEASLALIASIIDREAKSRIQVIGRGSQWVDSRTREYVRAVAKAILRRVRYERILILDSELPANGLVWLLLLERFIALPAYRGNIALHVVKIPNSAGFIHQFQIVDETYLHRTNRDYPRHEAGASGTAESSLAIAPHAEVTQYIAIFRQQSTQQSQPLTHTQVSDLIKELLTTGDPAHATIRFHWDLVLKVCRYLDDLDVPDLPSRGVEFVGSLMPFTFTFEAADHFVRERNRIADGKPTIVLPFERFDDAVRAFHEGRLEYLCVPVENTLIDQVLPPTISEYELNALGGRYPVVAVLEIEVSYVLAGVPKKRSETSRLASVNAAFGQVDDALPNTVTRMKRVESEPQSNYHAAWIASRDTQVLAITTKSAAEFFGLHVYQELRSGGLNVTRFHVYSRAGT